MKIKRFFVIVFCFVISISCVSCKKKRPTATYNVGIAYLGVSVDKFAQRLQEEDLESKDFYVLAPQYVSGGKYEAGFGFSYYPIYQDSSETETYQRLVRECFYVCNEEKYGKQITDWGQRSGLAANFWISISINADYKEKINNLKFEYYYEESRRGETLVYANIYNGEYCFATIESSGYDCKFAVLKSNVESYVAEFLMLKSEFLKFYENGRIEEPIISEDLATNARRRLWPLSFLGIDRFMVDGACLWIDYVEDTCTYVYLTLLPYGEKPIYGSEVAYDYSSIVAQDRDENDKFIEPYLCQHLQSRVEEFCDTSHNGQGNIWFDIMVIPIPSVDVDMSKITFEWWSNSVVNLYYEGYLFATATYSLCSDCEKDVAFVQDYVEDFISVRLAKIS